MTDHGSIEKMVFRTICLSLHCFDWIYSHREWPNQKGQSVGKGSHPFPFFDEDLWWGLWWFFSCLSWSHNEDVKIKKVKPQLLAFLNSQHPVCNTTQTRNSAACFCFTQFTCRWLNFVLSKPYISKEFSMHINRLFAGIPSVQSWKIVQRDSINLFDGY